MYTRCWLSWSSSRRARLSQCCNSTESYLCDPLRISALLTQRTQRAAESRRDTLIQKTHERPRSTDCSFITREARPACAAARPALFRSTAHLDARTVATPPSFLQNRMVISLKRRPEHRSPRAESHEVFRRHEALRTVFPIIDGQPLQMV